MAGVSAIGVYFRPNIAAIYIYKFKSKQIHIFFIGSECNLNVMHLSMKDEAEACANVLS